ncbi:MULTISPECIES: hypothetical protein [unclassified Streptomyces]|uniref:hypothetical protein n=1 Tax=unclassified Streptomyces TaxID=2593676 RepID=UPI00225345B5|nr:MULTISPECIES: hypothetical protein [unclassified Streptomyces]MCX4863462.1 hypothetical protein [Streptomyces sp. NBC_00906]MCX4894699.1 hypothetical protein [Streptomyces sp. NBC_00892]
MPRYLINYPKGHGEDILVEDEHLTLAIDHGWAVLADQAGACLVVSSHAGATITRIDEPEGEQSEG